MSRREDALALQCKVELADWCETSDAGCTITLRLHDSKSLDLLKAAFMRRSNGADPRYLLHLLKMDETHSSVDPVRRERLINALQGEPLSRNVRTLSRDPDFWRFLEKIDLATMHGEIDEVRAKQYIFRVCDIQCRRDLDQNQEAAHRYQAFIKPFLEWLQAQ